MKGFLFSTEALLSMSVIILALLIVQYEPTQTSNIVPEVLFQNQNAQSTTLYFNLAGSSTDATNTNQYCTIIGRYSPITKNYFDSNVCRGIK
ncbi:MAG: hypothetical protein WCW44_00640 [archaeon]|jgi:hypothetical protein